MVVFVVLDDLPSACGCLLATGTSTTIILCSLNTPIEGVVILVAFTDEKAAEEFAQVRIIRFVVGAECTSVVEEDAKFIGETMARVLHRYGNTRGVSKTGNTGMGMVVDFGTPQHTAYPYRCDVERWFLPGFSDPDNYRWDSRFVLVEVLFSYQFRQV
jgi:hypothetical protein